MKHDLYRFQLLPPAKSSQSLTQISSANRRKSYEFYLSGLQRLRGRSYVEDGAIQPCHLDAEGRHRMSDDEECWHFLLVTQAQEVIGCARFLVHSPDASFEQLRIAASPLAAHPVWGSKLRMATDLARQAAKAERISYAELGGWAIAEQYRNTKAALEVLIGSYVWAEMMGHCICSCTATVRNHSSSILRRMGATSLTLNGEAIPAYEDHHYGCTMELLGFDSRQLPARFRPLLNQMRPKLAYSAVLTDSAANFSAELSNLQFTLAQMSSGLNPGHGTRVAYAENCAQENQLAIQ